MSVTYIIQRADTEFGTYSDVSGDVTSPSNVSGQDGNRVYWYRIKKTVNGSVLYSNRLMAVMLDASVASAVGGNGADHIHISWTTTCASQYRVYKWIDDINKWHDVYTGSDNYYDDPGVSWNKTYFYFVVGVTPDGYEGPASNIVSASITGGVFTMSRATTYQGVQVGPESTAGTLVTATKRLLNIDLTMTPNLPIKAVRSPASKAAVGVQRGVEWTEGKYTAAADFNLLQWIFNSMYGAASDTTDSNGSTGKIHTWKPSPLTPLTPKSYSIEQGSSAGAEKWAYGVFTDMTLKWTDTDFSIDGSLFAQATQRGASLTTSATELTVTPIDPYAVGVYYSTDGTSFTKFNDVLDWQITLPAPFKPVIHANDTGTSFDDVVELSQEFSAQITFEEGSEVTDVITKMKASTKTWVGVIAQGPLIDTTGGAKYHIFRLRIPGFFTKENPGDKSDVWGNQISFIGGHDASYGMAEIMIENITASVS